MLFLQVWFTINKKWKPMVTEDRIQDNVWLTKVDVEGTPLLGAGKKVPPLHVEIPGTNCLGTQAVKQRYLRPWSYTHCGERKTERVSDRQDLYMSLYACACVDTLCNSQSAFFKDCFFLEGLEMTLILLLRKSPMLALFPYNIFTDSMKCFLLSESLIYNVFAVQKC